MAWGNFVLDEGFSLAVGGSTTKYRMVKMGAATGQVTAVTAITDDPIGVDQFGVSAAEQAKGKGSTVRVMGVSEVEAAGAIPIGSRCTLETTGVVSALVGASGKRIVGICVGSPAAIAGDRISMLILHGLALA